MIYILTAPIQSGKTSSLINWAAKRDDVFGILTPVVDGKRVFKDANCGEQFPMEASEGEEKLVVGKYQFSKKGFEKAIRAIRNAIDKEGWLVIDEVGPLELRGEGFDEVLREVFSKRKGKILLVVRDGLEEKVIEYYGIEGCIISSLSGSLFE